MPLYGFHCDACGAQEDLLRTVEGRNEPAPCPTCARPMRREISLPHLDLLDPYFDEGLGCDIYSAHHRRQVMKQLGVIEAGDRRGGAIDFDKKAPEHVGKLPCCGKAPPVGQLHKDTRVQTVTEDGKVAFSGLWSELDAM